MAVKTSLVVETFNPNTNKNVTKTATYANPDATDAQLNNFAQKMYGSSGLSANTVNSVTRVDKKDITNAEPDNLPLFSHTELSASTTPYELIAKTLGWTELDSVTESNGNITFSGTEQSSFGPTDASTEVSDADTFLTFDLYYNEEYEEVEVTFEDLYSVMSDTNCTFADFATLMTAKNTELNIPITVTYSGANSGFLLTPTDDTIENISFDVEFGGWGSRLARIIGEYDGFGYQITFEWYK